ncbi:MAG: tRNA pseudouridine(55) synthase TruB [Hyphomicrobiaceae bacterium]
MARRKKGNPVHGWLVLDKPLNITSNKALGTVKRLFNAQKAGHAGTLDPLASGILPIAFGEATKTVSYAVDGEKAYRFTVQWGAETTTDDAEGEFVATSDKRPGPEDINAVLDQFVGEIAQVPPKFSAIKVDGERAYDLARDGEDVELAARPVFIDSLTAIDHPQDGQTVFEATCGKGTYVRALARDMGRVLGCYGYVIALRRTKVGPFDEEQAVTLDEIREIGSPPEINEAGVGDDFPEFDAETAAIELRQFLQPVATALRSLPDYAVTANDAASLSRGQAVLLRGRDAPVSSGMGYATCGGEVVALVEADRGSLKPFRVFHLG